MLAILNRPKHALQIAAAMFPRVALASAARADNFQWEYINPERHTFFVRLRKKQSVRIHFLLASLLVLILSLSAYATDRIYTLVPDTPFDDSPFGFSGTITTDGSTDHLRIKDWSITIETPSTVDGISREVFTRASGPPLFFTGNGGVRITESSISILPEQGGDGPSDYVRISLGIFDDGSTISPTWIRWSGPSLRDSIIGDVSVVVPGDIVIADVGESPEFAFRRFGDRNSLPFATGGVAVPEPCGVIPLICALAAIFATRRTSLLRCSRTIPVATSMFFVVIVASASHANIFQWEYINSADPSQGKQQSTTLVPGGAGVNAAPGAILFTRNLTRAYLIGADLTNANGRQTNLTDADLSRANLAKSYFSSSNLNNADLIQANLTKADFNSSNLTNANLYQANLTNALFYSTNLTNANLSQANLTNGNFSDAVLTDAVFTDAQVQGARFFGITSEQLYSTASYQAHDLTGIALSGLLSGWNFAGQNLTNANFYGTLNGTDFTGAEVRGAKLLDYSATGFTTSQLYSTASYQAHDMTGISLEFNEMSGWNFAGQKLSNASFRGATITGANLREANLVNSSFSAAILTNADFTGADVRGANFDKEYGSFGYSLNGTGITLTQLYSTASYQTHDLTGISLGVNDLSGWNFTGQNLSNASFVGTNLTNANLRGANLTNAHFGGALFCYDFSCTRGYANLINADFTDAEVTGADLGGTGITPSQLYSTASYQAYDLRGIKFGSDDRSGWNFAGQNLTNSRFGTSRPGPNSYQVYAIVAGADFTGADARGAYLNPADAITTNLILPDGHINGLELDGGVPLVVRDYDVNPALGIGPIPITVDQHFAMGPGGMLRMVFEANAWDSTISFAPGIPVTLGGTLELAFADDVNLASQIGRTFDLFDWTGVAPIGVFAVSSPYAWDLSNLYTTGEVTLTAVPEPSGLFLLSSVLAAILTIQRRANLLPSRALQVAAGTLSVVVLASASQADIYQWEYINPADPSQGKRQSNSLAPDGADVDAGPRANLAGRDLTMAYLQGARFSLLIFYDYLEGVCCANKRFSAANLTATNLTRADLANASFGAATLTDADFTGADISGASFGKPIGYLNNTRNLRPLGTGISIEQIYPTASYQAHDLSTIDFSHNYFAGANFAGQNLAHASFYGASVAGADFTGAEVRGANFGKHFNEDVNTSPRQTFLSGSGISLEQLYSTASYQAKDLSGINFEYNNLYGANFAGQNLTNTVFSDPVPTGANLTAADARGAWNLVPARVTSNLIWSDGLIHGLDLVADELLTVRDYDGNPQYTPTLPPIPITVDQHFAIEAGGTLRMVFEADAWDSTISFEPDIPVTLGGTLELTFAGDVNLASQLGRTFDLFDWTGATPTGAFAVSSPYAWDLSNLYTTGEVTLTAVPEVPCIAFTAAGAFGLTFFRRRIR